MYPEIEFGNAFPCPDNEGRINEQGLWVPVEQDEFWGFWNFIRDSKDERYLNRVIEYAENLHRAATLNLPTMHKIVSEFFDIPYEHLLAAEPEIHLNPSITTFSGYDQYRNYIELTFSTGLPFFLGQTKDLKGTKLFPTYGHEYGHYAILAALAKGQREKLAQMYETRIPSIKAYEFIARICQNLIAESFNIYQRPARPNEFSKNDNHRAFLDADFMYPEIKNWTDSKRNLLITNPETITQFLTKFNGQYHANHGVLETK